MWVPTLRGRYFDRKALSRTRMMWNGRSFYFVCLVVLAATVCSCIQFDLPANEEKCFSEEMPHNIFAMIDYSVLPGYSTRVDISIYNPLGKSIYRRVDANKGKFALTATVPGDYKLCFTNRLSGSMRQRFISGLTRRIKIEILYGADAKDYSDVAKKGELSNMELTLKKAEDTVKSIHREFLYMKKREEALRQISDSTKGRVVWFTIFTITTVMSTAFIQVRYLGKFFREKKVV